MVFTLVGRLRSGSGLLVLFVACDWLLSAITIITAYLIISDDCATRWKKQSVCHWANLLAGTGHCFRHNMYPYILYQRCEDDILGILCTDLLPTITTIAG